MKEKSSKFDSLDKFIVNNLKKYSFVFLRYFLAFVFIWFGFLKIIDLSSATELVKNTIYWFNPLWFIPLLGVWEVLIGLCLLFKPVIRIGLGLMFFQMIGTFLPLILLPHLTFTVIPFVPTLEGQYIIKNLVFIAAAMVIGSHLRDKQDLKKSKNS